MSDTLQNNTTPEKIQDTKLVETPKLDDGWTTVVSAKTKKRQNKLKKRLSKITQKMIGGDENTDKIKSINDRT